MKKTLTVLPVISKNVPTAEQVIEDFYNSEPGSTIRKRLSKDASTLAFSYHKWINICTSHIDDEAFMNFFLKEMSRSVEATFEQWWMTYDLAEYSLPVREFALGKMIKIKDFNSWTLVHNEYDLKDDLDSELYLTAIKILSELGSGDKILEYGLVDEDKVDEYFLEKELSGRSDS